MAIQTIIYYAGFVSALALCWGLGPIFFYPMLADLIFDVCLSSGLFSGWDIRLLVSLYGLAAFIWVIALSGVLAKTTFVAVLLLDMLMIFYKILPQLQLAGTGQDFWNATSTGIYEVWLISIFVVITSMAVRSSLGAKIKGLRIDLLTNPRKRFLLPIGVWAGVTLLLGNLERWIPVSVFDDRFVIAAHTLVWGWVILELPQYLIHRRLMKQIS
jgi:hypothetical protein